MNKDNRHIWIIGGIIIVVLALSAYVSRSLAERPSIDWTTVGVSNITQGLTEDGTVVSSQDLALAFEQGGTVEAINVAVGDHVKAGQALVKLDTSSVGAAVSQAQAALASAQASYQKLINGQTSASIAVGQAAVTSAQTALSNAQKNQTATIAQQNQVVQNAMTSLLNSGLAATASLGNVSSQSPSITGAYTGTTQGQYTIKLYNSGGGMQFTVSGLETGNGQASSISPQPLGTDGLKIQFPAGQLYTGDSWTVNIPNASAASYVTNLNAYNAALQAQNQAVTVAQATVNSAQTALSQAQASLTLTQTPPRPEDIDTAKAQVASAQAALETAENNLNNSIITAPIDGVITAVDTKIGETVPGSALVPGTDAVKMISDQNFQIQTYVSEADIGQIQVGENASVTLDTYGNSVIFPATIIAIDPSDTVQNGINTYKTTLQFSQADDRIKEGMDANITLTGQSKPNALVVPSSSIITKDNQTYVLAMGNNNTPELTQVTTGISSVDGMTEILSGLSNGQQIASFGN